MPGIAKAAAQETTFTLRDAPYTYFQLQLVFTPSQASQSRNIRQQNPTLDEISLRQYLSSALTQSFGITGSAVAIDILRVDGSSAWLRVQSEDADIFMAALGQWSSAAKGVSLRVLGRSTWLGGLDRHVQGKTDF